MAAAKKGAKRPSGPRGEHKVPRVTFRSDQLDEFREAAAAAGEDLNTWLNIAARQRLATRRNDRTTWRWRLTKPGAVWNAPSEAAARAKWERETSWTSLQFNVNPTGKHFAVEAERPPH